MTLLGIDLKRPEHAVIHAQAELDNAPLHLLPKGGVVGPHDAAQPLPVRSEATNAPVCGSG